MTKYELNVMEKDALIETASICAGNVSTVLSNLVDEEINLKISEADLFPIKEIPKLITKGEKLVIGPKMLVVEIYAPLRGDISGNMLTLFSKNNALLLLDLIKKEKLGTTEILEKKEMAILKKMGDDILSIYSKQISTFLGLRIKSGDSRIISTFGKHLMDFALSGIHKDLKYALILKTDFSIISKIMGSFTVLIAFKSPEKLLDLIRKKLSKSEE